jgi:hypothetical protein
MHPAPNTPFDVPHDDDLAEVIVDDPNADNL